MLVGARGTRAVSGTTNGMVLSAAARTAVADEQRRGMRSPADRERAGHRGLLPASSPKVRLSARPRQPVSVTDAPVAALICNCRSPALWGRARPPCACSCGCLRISGSELLWPFQPVTYFSTGLLALPEMVGFPSAHMAFVPDLSILGEALRNRDVCSPTSPLPHV